MKQEMKDELKYQNMKGVGGSAAQKTNWEKRVFFPESKNTNMTENSISDVKNRMRK